MKKNIKELSLHEKDTGSSEVQIGLLTDKIETLSKHVLIKFLFYLLKDLFEPPKNLYLFRVNLIL